MAVTRFKRRIDVAAFQMEAVHEEIAASFFKAFGDLGRRSKGYFNERIVQSRGDFFSIVSHPRASVDFVPMEGRPAWNALAEAVAALDPRLVYFNTLQRDGIANWARQFGKPILGVVHNPKLFEASEVCRELARSGGLDAFVLACHVRDDLLRRCPELEGRIHVVYPWVWGSGAMEVAGDDRNVLAIAILGAVDFSNRDFAGLIDFLRERGDRVPRPFRLRVLAGGPGRGRLEAAIAEHGLERYFDLAPLDPQTKRVPHAIYLDGLRTCDAVLTLLPHDRGDYLESKITTGVVAALGLDRPIIAPPVLGEVYGFSPLETPADRPYDLEAVDLSASALAQRRLAGQALRMKAIVHNRNVVRSVLKYALKRAR